MGADITSRVLPILSAACLLLAACDALSGPPVSPEPTTRPTPTVRARVFPTPRPGWSLYARSTYQLALPDEWQEVKLEEAELNAAIARAQDSNPPLAEELRALLESGQSRAFVFYATNNERAPVIQNVSVARLVTDGVGDVSSIAQEYANALPNIVRGAQLLELRVPLELNGLSAARIVYDVSLVDSGGDLKTLRGVQYIYLLDTGDAYLLTITGDATDANEFMPLARDIATSFVGVTP
jgi:hypothetical protein